MFSSFPAFQRYMLHLYAIDIHIVAQQYELSLLLMLLDLMPGTFRLDTRFLHTEMSDSNSVNATLFTRALATQWYRLHLYTMDIHGVRFCYKTGIYVGTFRLNAR